MRLNNNNEYLSLRELFFFTRVLKKIKPLEIKDIAADFKTTKDILLNTDSLAIHTSGTITSTLEQNREYKWIVSNRNFGIINFHYGSIVDYYCNWWQYFEIKSLLDKF